MARYTDDSRDRVRDAVDMVDLVGSRVELRRAGVNRFEGLLPLPRRAHAVVRDQPGREALLLLRLRRGRRRVQVRPGDRGRRLRGRARVPGRSLRRRAGARRGGSGGGPAARRARAAARAARAHGRLLRALPVGLRGGLARPRVPRRARARRGRAARVPRRLRAERVGQGARRLAAHRLHRPRARGGGPRVALAEGGPHLRPLPPADHVPAVRPARARARLRRARHGRRPEAQVPQLVGRRGLPQGPPSLRRRHRPDAARPRPAR